MLALSESEFFAIGSTIIFVDRKVCMGICGIEPAHRHEHIVQRLKDVGFVQISKELWKRDGLAYPLQEAWETCLREIEVES